jgi:hypothetical protein
LAKSPELPPNVHGGLSSAGVSVCGPYFNERYARSRDPEHWINVPLPDASTCICLIRHAQPRVHMNVPQLSCQMIEMQDPIRHTVPMHGVQHVHMQRRNAVPTPIDRHLPGKLASRNPQPRRQAAPCETEKPSTPWWLSDELSQAERSGTRSRRRAG